MKNLQTLLGITKQELTAVAIIVGAEAIGMATHFEYNIRIGVHKTEQLIQVWVGRPAEDGIIHRKSNAGNAQGLPHGEVTLLEGTKIRVVN